MTDARNMKRAQVKELLLQQQKRGNFDMKENRRLVISIEPRDENSNHSNSKRFISPANSTTSSTGSEEHEPEVRMKPVPTATPPPKPKPGPRINPCTEKLSNLLSFLDEVDSHHTELTERAMSTSRSSASQLQQNSIRTFPSIPSAGSPPGRDTHTLPRNASYRSFSTEIGDSYSLSSRNGTSSSLVLELENKTKLVQRLKKALTTSRRERDELKSEHSKNLDRKMSEQKSIHDSTVKRQLSFIEKLVDDKKVLASKLEELSKKLSKQESNHQSATEKLQKQHQNELAKVKEGVLKSEKLRRAAWEKKKLEEIKKSTIKGLEPEMERILQKHREDKRALEGQFQVKLQRQLEATEMEKHKALKDARYSAECELKKAVAEEHKRMQQLLNDSDGRASEQLNQQRIRFEQELQELKDRNQNELQNAETKFMRQLENERNRGAELLAEAKRRNMLEHNDQREAFELEKQQWQSMISSQLRQDVEKEKAKFKEQLCKERDQRLKVIVTKLNKDQVEEIHQLEEAHETKLENAVRKYKLKIESLEEEITEWQHKYDTQKEFKSNTVRAFDETKVVIRSLEKQLAEKEDRIASLSKKLATYDERIDEQTAGVRREFLSKQQTLLERVKHLEDERAQHEVSVARMERDLKKQIQLVEDEKEQELSDLHRRIQSTIANKDETIDLLARRHQEAEDRAEQLEDLLEKQREELLADL